MRVKSLSLEFEEIWLKIVAAALVFTKKCQKTEVLWAAPPLEKQLLVGLSHFKTSLFLFEGKTLKDPTKDTQMD